MADEVTAVQQRVHRSGCRRGRVVREQKTISAVIMYDLARIDAARTINHAARPAAHTLHRGATPHRTVKIYLFVQLVR